MAGRFVRESKLRNVFGKEFKKDQCFESIRVTKNNNAQLICAVNPKLVAVVTDKGGGNSLLVLPHSKTGRIATDPPQLSQGAAIIDIAWSPFNDNLIASSDENGFVNFWVISDEGVTENCEEPSLSMKAHEKRCSMIRWHPLAENVLLTAGMDSRVCVWNMDDASIIVDIKTTDVVQDLCWSPDGKKFATASKDKKIRIYNGRTGQLEQELAGHDSPREMRISLLKDNKLLTTGFTRESRREYKLMKLKDHGEPECLLQDQLDQTNAPLYIFADPDLNIVYLVGKGDSVFRYYEVNDEEPYFHYISTHQSKTAQRGMGFMPKRGLNVNACEIARMYKVSLSSSGSVGTVEPISMIVPRKSELYQEDIYPDTLANEYAVQACEWLEGKDGTPKYMSMQQFFKEKESSTSSRGGGLGGLGGLKKGGLKSTTPAASAPAKKEEPKAAPISSVRPPVSSSNTVENENKAEPVPVDTPAVKAAPSAKPQETKPEPETKVEKKPDPTPPASQPPPSPKAPAPKAQSKDSSESQTKTKELTTPKGGKAPPPPVMDGKMFVSDILLDIRNLRNTVSRHEASIEALEELQLSQSQEMKDLVAEVARLKSTVEEQEKRIAALEARN
ncbi:coronin-1A-like [Lytechinus pictus]|uniref:coronin-1A-like n=1 Tax=Lytechinus pictus TaxID=7653 RepID=UPI0030BA1BDB